METQRRQKILYILTKSVWGGAQRYVYDLATNLPRNQFEAIVAGGGDGTLFAKLRTAGIRTISIPGLQRDVGITREWRVFLHIVGLLKNERPDVVHLNSSKAGGLGAIAAFLYRIFQVPSSKFQVQIIFTAHGWGFHEDRPRLARAAIFFVSWFSSLFQDKIIVLDTIDFAAAEKFITRRKLALIPNGIKEIDFYARADARAFLAKKINRAIAADTLLIGTIAELTKNKGLPHFIDAIDRLTSKITSLIRANKGLKRNSGLIVCIIGDGEEKENLKKHIGLLGLNDTVFLAGFIPDASRALTALDIFVLPSLKEGLPYAVMEAMAAGLPVIATAVGGIPDIITHGADGFLVPPKDPEALAVALGRIAPGDARARSAMAERARSTIQTKFSFDAMMKCTISLYSECRATT